MLSGGNQQKVIVARWLETRAKVLFFDEPARGIDVGAKAEMFGLIGELAKEGNGMVLISSYLPELLNMCDRILVMREGEVAGVIEREEFSRGADHRPRHGSEGGSSMSSTTATTGQRAREALRERFSDVVSQLAAAGALIVVFIVLSFASPVFLTADNLFNIGSQTAVTAVIAVGMTMVIITAGIDLSVGSVSALAGVLGVMLITGAGLPVPLAILGGILVGAWDRAGQRASCVSMAGLNPFIATLGMLTVARGLVYIFTNAKAVFGAPDSFRLLGQGVIGPIPIPIIIIAAGRGSGLHSPLAHPARALRLRDGLEPRSRPALRNTHPALPDERLRHLGGAGGFRRHDRHVAGQLGAAELRHRAGA